MAPLILASGSQVRRDLLTNAAVDFDTDISKVDEDAIKRALIQDTVHPRDIADALAEAKARKVSSKHPGSLVIGCDQILSFDGRILSKPSSKDQALEQLRTLSGKTHHLFSAAVIYEEANPVWRHVGHVRLRMREVSEDYLQSYVDRNWEDIQDAVGSYKLEKEGVRLMAKIEGDFFNVLGLPLIELLSYLTHRGTLQG